MEEDFIQEPRRTDYETAFMLSGSASEDARIQFLERIRRFIADNDGEVIDVGSPKHYTLAYPVKRQSQGVFSLIIYRGAPALPQGIAETVRHDDVLLRHLTVERPRKSAKKTYRGGTTPFAGPQQTQNAAEAAMTADENKTMDEQIEAALHHGDRG